jgi:uncharacterized protein YjbI with pentapeptide repeats
VQASRIIAIAVLTLLVAPLCAYAQQPTRLDSLQKPCRVRADPRWTQQEKFVWERVCVGEDADFNTAPGYGGEFDPNEPRDWSQSRVLRPEFLATILLEDPYSRALTRRGVTIVGARFTDGIDLSYAELQHPVALIGSLIEGGMNLTNAHFSKGLNLNNSKVTRLVIMEGLFASYLDMDGIVAPAPSTADRTKLAEMGLPDTIVDLTNAHIAGEFDLIGAKVAGKLDMKGIQVDSDLFMGKQAESATGERAEFAEVDLWGAHITGLLEMSGSKLTGKLKMLALSVGDLEMKDRAEFAAVDLTGAHVSGYLELGSSKVTGNLEMTELQVDRDLLMGDKAEFAKVDLDSAHVSKYFELNSSKVTGKLTMLGLEVGSNLSMKEAEFAEVDLSGASVGWDLELSGSQVTGKLTMKRLQVSSDLLMNHEAEFAEISLVGAHVKGQLDLSGSRIAGQLDCAFLEVDEQVLMRNGAVFRGPIDCSVAKVKGDLDLSNGDFTKDVDFSSADIGGALKLTSVQWADDGALTLRNAKIDAIPDLAAGWPPRLEVDGLTYRSVAGANQLSDWLAKLDRYAPQPYEQLASVVQSKGDTTLARSIRYRGRERQRAEADGLNWLGLTTLKFVIGYGYYPYLALFWAIGLVLAGAIVLRISGEATRHKIPLGLAYSFDMLLPIIELRKKHSDIDLESWARYYFYGQKIMGWILGLFLIAAVSGLTK